LILMFLRFSVSLAANAQEDSAEALGVMSISLADLVKPS